MPVVGIEELAALARELKDAGEVGLRKEMYQGLGRAGKPMKAEARKGALEDLPKEGGLAEEIAASRFSVRNSLLGRNPRITITGKGRTNDSGREHDLRAMDRGRIRHPSWGRRGARDWKTQTVRPGWFTERMEKAAPLARDELQKAVDSILRKLGRGAP